MNQEKSLTIKPRTRTLKGLVKQVSAYKQEHGLFPEVLYVTYASWNVIEPSLRKAVPFSLGSNEFTDESMPAMKVYRIGKRCGLSDCPPIPNY